MVGAGGLEPPTSASRTLRASHLRYAPFPDYVCPTNHFPHMTNKRIIFYKISWTLVKRKMI